MEEQQPENQLETFKQLSGLYDYTIGLVRNEVLLEYTGRPYIAETTKPIEVTQLGLFLSDVQDRKYSYARFSKSRLVKHYQAIINKNQRITNIFQNTDSVNPIVTNTRYMFSISETPLSDIMDDDDQAEDFLRLVRPISANHPDTNFYNALIDMYLTEINFFDRQLAKSQKRLDHEAFSPKKFDLADQTNIGELIKQYVSSLVIDQLVRDDMFNADHHFDYIGYKFDPDADTKRAFELRRQQVNIIPANKRLKRPTSVIREDAAYELAIKNGVLMLNSFSSTSIGRMGRQLHKNDHLAQSESCPTTPKNLERFFSIMKTLQIKLADLVILDHSEIVEVLSQYNANSRPNLT